MRIVLITPAPPGSQHGNRITALRWARLIRSLGHRVTVLQRYDGRAADLMIAMHARKSYGSIARWRGPLVLVLPGTDLYRDLGRSANVIRAMKKADRLVVLQPLGTRRLPAWARRKTRVVMQSAVGSKWKSGRDVCVIGHLRAVKDPFRAALAARRVPGIRVVHVGRALTPAMARRARAERKRNPAYRWLGEVPRAAALRLMAHSRALVLSSTMEGGANVLTEAIAGGVPVLASRIDGSVGILGAGYPGYFRVGDTVGLARLLSRDDAFYARLRRWVLRLRPRFTAARERAAWGRVLAEVTRAAR